MKEIDRKLIQLHAYIKACQGKIKNAKEQCSEQINIQIAELEKLITDEESVQAQVLDAFQKEDDIIYWMHMQEIQKNYELPQILNLQRSIIQKIKNAYEENNPSTKSETSTNLLIKQNETTIKDKYKELIDKHQLRMHQIRKKIDIGIADEEEKNAFFAYSITELITLQKRKHQPNGIIQEEKTYLAQQIKKAVTKNHPEEIIEAYSKELKEIGLEPEKLIQNKV